VILTWCNAVSRYSLKLESNAFKPNNDSCMTSFGDPSLVFISSNKRCFLSPGILENSKGNFPVINDFCKTTGENTICLKREHSALLRMQSGKT